VEATAVLLLQAAQYHEGVVQVVAVAEYYRALVVAVAVLVVALLLPVAVAVLVVVAVPVKLTKQPLLVVAVVGGALLVVDPLLVVKVVLPEGAQMVGADLLKTVLPLLLVVQEVNVLTSTETQPHS
jgi:hypothetical protein